MIKRALILPKRKSFFLFGPRNTGKTTLIESQFDPKASVFFDLLDTAQEARFSKRPGELYDIVISLPDSITHVVIDEIQKVPKLLDEVQRLMKLKKWFFILTGSSARKLKHGGANLLAGRAFVYNLYPFSFIELTSNFNLKHALQWGTLPEVFECETAEEKSKFLSSYAHTYLKEEIWGEHLIRQLEPFRRFLEIAAQANGKLINYSKIARDVNVDEKTIKVYFQILEDTLIGFYLEPFHQSVRKRQKEKPKFYFFDTGVVRALAGLLSVPLQESTNGYGNVFEHYVITECVRLGSYYKPEYRFSHIRTASDVEVDLVIERPGSTTLLIEIKSSRQVMREQLASFMRLSNDIPNSAAICLSNDPYKKQLDNITVYPWEHGLKEIFEID